MRIIETFQDHLDDSVPHVADICTDITAAEQDEVVEDHGLEKVQAGNSCLPRSS